MNILTNCIIGFIFIVIGLVLRAYPPEHINNSLGYRTPFSILIRYLYSNNSNLSMRISSLINFNYYNYRYCMH
ncbi:hypothetical protein BN906_01614 [Clostridium tetani 12124569]|nr:hypothetical protein BN906_01614 [Clostridium tetani 12124569]